MKEYIVADESLAIKLPMNSTIEIGNTSIPSIISIYIGGYKKNSLKHLKTIK